MKILNENNFSQDDCILIIRTILNKSKDRLTLLKVFKNNNLKKLCLVQNHLYFGKIKRL